MNKQDYIDALEAVSSKRQSCSLGDVSCEFIVGSEHIRTIKQALQDKISSFDETADSGWLDISTAPKDGTPFLAKQDDEIYHCVWMKGNNAFAFRTHTGRTLGTVTTKKVVDGEELKIILKEGEFKFIHSWCIYTKGFNFNPSEWMPLPNTPKEEDNE